ncbi:MAG: SDR family NAD(P)-dependent oxidoreductase [Pirellulaceae bacterium]|nr:SDR family NAD(P)-dependent oxidoreductase [Pirellulaceae bacterium]
MKIAGATFLVAGGSSGLGAACVKLLSSRQADVVNADVQPPTNAVHNGATYHQTDITDENSVLSVIDSIDTSRGELRGVIICAGIIHGARIAGREGPFDLDAFRRVIDVNLIGTFNVLRLAADRMQHNPPDENGEQGIVIMTSSIAAFEGQIGQAAYAASKGGVAALTLPAARELAPLGIRVVTVAPGVFETPMMKQVSDKYHDALQMQTLFPKRFGRPCEFAQLVVNVIENPMINGTTLRLDGGMRMPAK